MDFKAFLLDIDSVELRVAKRQQEKLQKKIRNAAIQVVGGSALALYSCNAPDYGWWTTIFTTAGWGICSVGACHLFSRVRKYYNLLPAYEQKRMQFICELNVDTCVYLGSVYALSASLKENSILWIPCVGISIAACSLAVTSMGDYARIFSRTKPLFKFGQLIFGPALISGAAFYLLGIQKHGEEWLIWLPLIGNFVVGTRISCGAGKRLEKVDEPIWQLFKAMEHTTGGCLIIVNSIAMIIYATTKGYHPVLNIIFSAKVFWGLLDFAPALEAFQLYTDIPEYVLYSISYMVGGPIVFSSSCLIAKLVESFFTLPLFIFMAGTGISMLMTGIYDLYNRAPRPYFKRYMRRTLGPTFIVYGTLASVYVGYQTEAAWFRRLCSYWDVSDIQRFQINIE